MIPWIGPDADFPPIGWALSEPNGLLCAGADLSVARLRRAYGQGIFPWFSRDQPPLWWCPNPRAVFVVADLIPNRRLRRQLRTLDWQIQADVDFAAVMAACAQGRDDGDAGWITPAMQFAYQRLHQAGDAHCLSVYEEGALIGGLYGVAQAGNFFAESMFSRRSNASKCALYALAQWLNDHRVSWFDAQVPNPHTLRLGAQCWPREHFLAMLAAGHARDAGLHGSWTKAFAERGLCSAAAVAEARAPTSPRG